MTELDQKWAENIVNNVNALVLEIQRLEKLGSIYEKALKLIITKSLLSHPKAIDLPNEYKQIAEEALNN